MPAATEISKGRDSAIWGARPDATARICCGLTASTTTSAPLTALGVVGRRGDAVVPHQAIELSLARIGHHDP